MSADKPVPGDVQPNMVFGTPNVERKKYDPIYKIEVLLNEGLVIYVGRFLQFVSSDRLLTVKGFVVPQKKKGSEPTVAEMIAMFEKEVSVEDTFPISAFQRIRKIA